MWVGGRCRSLVFLVLLQGQHPPTRQSRILAGAVGPVFTDVSPRPGGGKGQGGGCKELSPLTNAVQEAQASFHSPLCS